MDIIEEFLTHPRHYILAFIIATISGFVIRPTLDLLTKRLKSPTEYLQNKKLDALFKIPKGGEVIGLLERIMYLFAFILNRPELILGWLVFKLGAQFQVWATIIKVPDHLKGVNDIEFLKAKKVWGDRKFQRFIIGTALNILISLFIYLGLLFALSLK